MKILLLEDEYEVVQTYSMKKALTFESGANDFIKKPFDLEELGQRISNIKRQFGLDSKIIIEEGIVFDMQTHSVENRSRVISSDDAVRTKRVTGK